MRPKPSLSFPLPTSSRSPGLAVAVGLVALALSWLTTNHGGRFLVSLPLLAAPGVCLVCAVLGTAAVTLDVATFWALAVLGSVVMLIAEALALTALGVRLAPGPFEVTSAALLIVLGAAAMLRVRHRIGIEKPPHPLRPVAALALAAAVAIAAVTAVVAGRLLPGPVPPDYTAINAAGSWADVTRAVPVQPGQRLRIPYTLQPSPQTHTSAYHLIVQMDGRTVGQSVTTVWQGQSYYGAATVAAPADGCLHRLTVQAQADTGWQGGLVFYLQGRSDLGCRHR